MAANKNSWRWKFAAYLIFTTVVIVSLVGTQRHQDAKRHQLQQRLDRRQDKFQRDLCASLLVLRANQKLVLITMGEWADIFADRTKAGLKPLPRRLDAEIRVRLSKIDDNVNCRVP